MRKLIACAVSATLAAAVTAGPLLGSGAAAAGPRTAATSQTIDAATDPQAAGKALSDDCEPISNCQFAGTVTKVDWDAPRVLGDALYNCGDTYAEDTVAISDERSETTSIDESLSLKVKLGFLGLASTAVEGEVDSGQLDEVATTLKQTNSVSVAPGEIGYTETRVPSAYLSGNAHVTNGVNLVTVTNMALTFPGYGRSGIDHVDWTDRHRQMSAADRHTRCAALPAVYPLTATRTSPRPRGERLFVCAGRRRRCSARRLIVDAPLAITPGRRLTLARGRVVYATGIAGRRRDVVRARRRIRRGAYTLLISGRRRTTMVRVKVR